MRGATYQISNHAENIAISIHAPRAGCDHRQCQGVQQEPISIHAPRAGCDMASTIRHNRARDFNPRTPCGVRLRAIKAKYAALIFQSTHPVRGATIAYLESDSGDRIFQSTHPVRGATRELFGISRGTGNFNPRTPCGVRPRNRATHSSVSLFQSTHPVRGATANIAKAISVIL